MLAEEQAALRRVATLVAHGVPAEELFAAVTDEVGRLLSAEHAYLGRYEPDGTVTIVAACGGQDAGFPVGERSPLGGENVLTIVRETGRPARIDGYAGPPGPVGVAVRERDVGSAVGAPIASEGALWGVVVVGSSREQPLPQDTEARLASFTELLATAVANAASRAGLARLAEEQAALRRVATQIAGGSEPEAVFAAVTEEVGTLFGAGLAGMVRRETDGALTLVATWAAAGEHPTWELAGRRGKAIWRLRSGGPADPSGRTVMTLFPHALPPFASSSGSGPRSRARSSSSGGRGGTGRPLHAGRAAPQGHGGAAQAIHRAGGDGGRERR